MGIQSTHNITREETINRITKISNMIKEKNYRELDQASFETDIDLQEFVDNWNPIDLITGQMKCLGIIWIILFSVILYLTTI